MIPGQESGFIGGGKGHHTVLDGEHACLLCRVLAGGATAMAARAGPPLRVMALGAMDEDLPGLGSSIPCLRPDVCLCCRHLKRLWPKPQKPRRPYRHDRNPAYS